MPHLGRWWKWQVPIYKGTCLNIIHALICYNILLWNLGKEIKLELRGDTIAPGSSKANQLRPFALLPAVCCPRGIIRPTLSASKQLNMAHCYLCLYRICNTFLRLRFDWDFPTPGFKYITYIIFWILSK